MANYFKIPLINPFRFVNRDFYDGIDPRYNAYPIDFAIDNKNPNGFYAQKWQLADFTKIQLDSDFDDVVFKIYNFCDETLYKTIALTAIATTIVGQTWTAYEAEVLFQDWDEGMYYGEITYTDENDEVQHVITSALDVREKHEGTLLYEYFNLFNSNGIIWNTGITMSIRVEGYIGPLKPQSEYESYTDQKQDLESLTDTPFGTYPNYIGSPRGLPDWFIKKMNTIFTVKSVRINGELFNKVKGQQFQMTNATGGPNQQGYAVIEIQPNFNGDLEQYKTGPTPDGDFVVIQRVIPYYNNAANIAVLGVFKVHYNLVGVAIWNRGANAFTLKIGTTNGGSEIGEYEVTNDITTFIEINKIFEQPQNVYLTGLDGTNLDIDIDYKDYDAIQITPGTTTGGFVENVEYTYYEKENGDFDRDWTAATGLGNAGTAFENCRLLIGINGTIDDTGLSRIGWDHSFPATRGTVIGAVNNFISLIRAQLPVDKLQLISNSLNTDRGAVIDGNSTIARASNTGNNYPSYELLKGAPGLDATLGLSAPMGSGQHIDITPESLVVARFIYVAPAP